MILLLVVYGAIYTAIRDNRLWLWYGAVYTAVVLIMGAYVIVKRKNRYVRVRTATLMFFQLFLFFILHRFLLPRELGKVAGYPWPLNISSLYPGRPDWVLAYAVIFAFVFIPIVTYFWGRRVYCGWICSCGAIAETLGDPFRKRAPKSKTANRLEIGMYIVLLIAILVTIATWLGDRQLPVWYNLIVMFYISGIIVMAAYPFMGGRIWCRFFCPAGAFIGAISKRGRFAISGDQEKCTECGICTANCQMGIDVRDFISNGTKIKSDQCVGCGICISMCPVKILKFEGGITAPR
ncbi:MAG: 4Fe-4S binding protein [Candidatus Hydrothermarchaeaceae archaeon]